MEKGMAASRAEMQTRSLQVSFETRADDNGDPIIEGYFAVFNSNYDIGLGMSESIAPGAFSDTISGDIRALVNHNTDLVLGRTGNRTLELSEDSRGLHGIIHVNPNDGDAMNAYERVKRGDVSQCSIGFAITDEETAVSDSGDIHWTIKAVKLYEVSVCTFPAYAETSVKARSEQREEILRRRQNAWRMRMKARLRNGNQGTDAEEKD